MIDLKNYVYDIILFLIKIIAAVFIPMKTVGNENVPREGSFIVVTNHTSMLDPAFLAKAILPRRAYYMGKEELFAKKLPNWLFTHIGGFPVSRGRGDIDAMRKCINILKKGECLSIFPEGTRSKNHIMQPFKTGVAFIAGKANTKILPVYIDTNNEGYKLFKKFELRIGKAVTLEEMGYLGKVSGKTLVKITEDIEKQVKMLIK